MQKEQRAGPACRSGPYNGRPLSVTLSGDPMIGLERALPHRMSCTTAKRCNSSDPPDAAALTRFMKAELQSGR